MVAIYLNRKNSIDTLTFHNITKFVFSDSSSYDELNSFINLPTITDTLTRCSFYVPFIQCVKINDSITFGTKCNEVNSRNPFHDEFFKVYPNPFLNNLFIDISNFNHTEINIYSLDNKLMFKIKLKSKNTLIQNLDLQAGVYVYIISENKK